MSQNIKLRHPVALRRSEFELRFFVVHVQRQFLFFCHFLVIVTTCFGVARHHLVYRLLCWRNLLLTVIMLCFSYVVALDSRLCQLTSWFIWVFLNVVSKATKKKCRTALQWVADSFITTTSTPDDSQLGWNM
jgi:hypothetical protein